MASPLPSEEVQPAFLPFFGMKRAPFLRLSAPGELFHPDQYALLRSHLLAATRQADSLVVVIGADRIGKTTLLNQFIEELDEEHCYATFDEACAEGIQFHRSFLEQIGLGEIVGTLRELQHISGEYLVHRATHGRHAVVFVDNAHLARPAVLEQLRWIADVKVEGVRACSMVLAGNLSFQRILDSPAMRSLVFRHTACFHVRALCEGETDEYIRHRLGLAGAADAAIFAAEARALIHRYTGGNPAMINLLCNEVLAESCAQGCRQIGEQRVRAAAQALGMPPHVVPIRGKGRRRNDPQPEPAVPDAGKGERMAVRKAPAAIAGAADAPLLQDVGIQELLVRINELSGQLERKADEEKRRALTEARKHDQDLGALRAQLAAQAELASSLSRALDDRAREIARLNAALLDGERLRQDADQARQSLADAQDQQAKQVEQLTRALNASESALAERDAAIRKLAAEYEKPDPPKSQAAKGPRDSLGDQRKQRRLGRRARSQRGNARSDPALATQGAEGTRAATTPPKAEAEIAAGGTGETRTLLPHQMCVVPAGEPPATAAHDRATAIELFLDSKPWKVEDLAGKPQRMMVGRAEDCDIRLDSKYVSRHHAILVNHEGRVAIEDLRSSNGIFVNTRKVDRCDLCPGDTVTIGNFWLRIRHG